ncbi:MAG: hypothetical protein N3G21_03600 [Candidatus Hydrogenedentes bacterium]|nr:hypothetical protein [Candidatus Hydrogenedentota bacterium]
MPTNIQDYSKKVELSTLEALFGSEARAKVLLILFTNLGKVFYQKQLETATKLPLRAIQRELEKLLQIGIIYSWKEGNRTWYQVYPEHPLINEIRALIIKTCDYYDLTRITLNSNENIRLAFIKSESNEILIVLRNGDKQTINISNLQYSLKILTSPEFIKLLENQDTELISFLEKSKDLLGNREDYIWRIIENMKLKIPKGENVL